MNRDEERLGLLFAGLCAANGAFVPAVAKVTTGHGDPLFVAAATSVWAGLCATCILAMAGQLRALVHPATGPRLVAIAALGTAGAFLLFFLGASRATAIDAALCLQTEPAYSLLLTWLALGHRPTRRRVLAIVVSLVGITLAVGAHGLSGSSGVWILLVTPLCWQVSHLIVLRGLIGVPPLILTGARYVHGGWILALVWLLWGGHAGFEGSSSWLSQMPLLALQGVILSYGGTLLWYQSITRLDLGRATAIVVPSIPVLSLGATFLLLGEVPSLRQWIGMGLTAGGVLAFVTAPHVVGEQRRTHSKVATVTTP